jgi:hypothetical protein
MGFVIAVTLLAIFRALPEPLHLRSILCDVVHIMAAPGEKRTSRQKPRIYADAADRRGLFVTIYRIRVNPRFFLFPTSHALI